MYFAWVRLVDNLVGWVTVDARDATGTCDGGALRQGSPWIYRILA